jgi:hypothetical protein
MEIQTRQLEIVFQKIISKLKEDGIDRVQLNQDMYAFLSNRDSYEMKQVIEKPLIGSLVDDWTELKKVSEDKQITTYVDFERLSSILKAICEELSPED